MEFNDWYLVIVPILIGTGMLCFWAFVVVAHRVPEIESGGIEIRFHIVAEVTTGLALIAGGLAVLIDGDAPSAAILSGFSLGLLAYTLIVSPGYYIERHDMTIVWVFAAIWLLTIPAMILRLVSS